MDAAFLFGARPADVDRVREALERGEYTARRAAEALGADPGVLLARDDSLLLRRRTESPTPTNTLLRLFLGGLAVSAADARRALAPLPLAAWIRAGLLAAEGDEVSGLIHLRPLDLEGRPVVVASDAPRRAPAADWVMGTAPSSRALLDMTVRRPAGRALDLGTGSGVQAVAASSHAEHVVATDRNRRAVAMARFTSALNRAGNVEVRSGDWFDPVAGERFGLIVSNPPFVISPESRFDYRDSGVPGDALCRRIVEAAPEHLEEGGWCQLVASWAHTSGRSWGEHLAEWFAGTGCDAWVIQRNVQPVDAYASTWIRHDEPDPEVANRTFEEWMGSYEQMGIEAVAFGLITMRRVSGRQPWLRVEELTQDLDACGDAIASGFERFTWLAEVGSDPRRLVQARLTVAEDVRLDQRSRWSPDGWAREEAWLRLSGGLRYSGSVDAEVTALLTGCDGTNRLGDVVHALAVAIEAPPEELALQVLPVVRHLVERGYLVPPAQDLGSGRAAGQ